LELTSYFIQIGTTHVVVRIQFDCTSERLSSWIETPKIAESTAESMIRLGRAGIQLCGTFSFNTGVLESTQC
jgi:hypothetical protein